MGDDDFEIDALDVDSWLEGLAEPDSFEVDAFLTELVEDNGSAEDTNLIAEHLLDILHDTADALDDTAAASPTVGRGGYRHGTKGGKRNIERAGQLL